MNLTTAYITARKEPKIEKRWNEFRGLRFGRLTTLRPAGKNGSKLRWLCRCDCGNEVRTPTITKLKSGHSRSCGCLVALHAKKMGSRKRPPKREGEELRQYWRDRNSVRRVKNKLEYRIRYRIWEALKSQSQRKSSKLKDLIGTDIDGFRKHLSSLFSKGMSWDNYGYLGWHIDHIRPCSSFDLSNKEEQRKCFHFSNCQPLWAKDNIAKRDRLI